MTPEQKKALEPFAQHLNEVFEPLRDMAPDELFDLLAACDAVTSTNCWYRVYGVASMLRDEISRMPHIAQAIRDRSSKEGV
jgi:hypothetical protein